MTPDVTEKGDAARDGPPDIKLSPAGDDKADSSDKEADVAKEADSSDKETDRADKEADKDADGADKEPAASDSAKKEVRVELDKEKTGDSLLDSKGKINKSQV